MIIHNTSTAEYYYIKIYNFEKQNITDLNILC